MLRDTQLSLKFPVYLHHRLGAQKSFNIFLGLNVWPVTGNHLQETQYTCDSSFWCPKHSQGSVCKGVTTALA